MGLKASMVILLGLVLSSCQSPFLVFAGGELSGEHGQAKDFAFAQGYSFLQLETDGGYSVNLRVTVIDGQLYIDAATKRRWAKHLEQDSNVRIRLGERIYPASARLVDDDEIDSHFLPGRQIYRIVPRNEPNTPAVGT